MQRRYMVPKSLPARWENFCRAYVVHFNAARAAGEAGFSPNGLYAQGAAMLTRPAVQERINQLMAPNRARMEATKERVLEELVRLAFADPREMFDETGKLKPIGDMEAHVAANIAVFEEESRIEGRGEDAEIVRTKKVRTWDKLKALEMLAKHLKMYSDAPQVVVPVQVNMAELRDLSPHERNLLRQLAESRAIAARADDEATGPAGGGD